MAKLSIDIGVNLGTAIRDLGTLKMAFTNITNEVTKLSSNLNNLKNIKANPTVTITTKNISQNSVLNSVQGNISQPKLASVPDIFVDYRRGMTSSATVSQFLETRQEALKKQIAQIQDIASRASSFKTYELALKKIGEKKQELDAVSQSIKRLGISTAQIPQQTEGGANGFNRISRATGQANMVLTNFGRLAQDSAYGILGISNNINPLVESWSQLNAEAKKTPGSSVWKELGKSLAGPGGLAIAFSGITAALSFAAVGLQYWTGRTKEAKSASKELQDEISRLREEYQGYYDDVNSFTSAYTSSDVELANLRQSLELGRKLTEEEKSKNKIRGIDFALAEKQAQLDAVQADITSKSLEEAKVLFPIQKKLAGDIADLTKERLKTELELQVAQKGIGKEKQKGELLSIDKVLKEINSDVNIINKNTLKPFDIKNEQIIGRLEEGIQYILDNEKLNIQLNADVSNAKARFNQLKEQLSAAQIDLFGAKRADEYQQYLEKLATIAETADILGTDRLDAQINETTGRIATLVEETRKFKQTKPFGTEQVNAFNEQLALSQNELNQLTAKLLILREQKIDVDITSLVKQFEKANRKIEANYKASIEKLKGGDSYAAAIEAKLKKDEDSLSNAMQKLGDSMALRFNPFDPRNIFLAGKIKKLQKEIDKESKDLKLAKLKDQLASEFDNAFTEATKGLLEGIGGILGGDKVKDVFAGIFGPLMESLGKALIKFAILTEKVQAAIKTLRENLFGSGGTFAVGAAIALGVALIAGGKLLAKANKGFAKGGYVSGDGHGTSDSIPARLSNGEYVVRANSVGKYGVGFLDSINNGTFKKFANGGLASLTMPRFVTANPGSLIGKTSMSNMGSMVVGETVIRGQDLKLVLSRADNRFNNTTSR